MITVMRICCKCGSKLLTDAPQGLCGLCLFKTALGPPLDESITVGHDGGSVDSAEILSEFGDYDLLEEIGRGGQGVVYRARHKSLNRTVALKVIGLGQWATQAHLKRFRREAEAAANLDHPCIVPIYEVGEREGSCYFSMKFIDGGQLDEVATRKPISPRNAAELIAKLARTVHYAHEHGILHRDIKPGNILLDATGEPHLTDFGLARLLETKSTVTHTMDVLGTPSYMAPEQASGHNEQLTSATDVYGLGAVFYQLLTGHPPFAGGTTYETVRLVLEVEPRQPRLWNPKIDRELATICLKCLEKDPKRRYSSALALAEDLEHWLKHEPIRAKRSGFFTHARKWVQRNTSIAVMAAMLLALAVPLGVMIWKGQTPAPPVANSPLPEKSVAVLPFENLSQDPDNAYFVEGIQEEILTRLARIADLKVISRTSTQQYQSKPHNLAEIAKQLGVANVLEGSVQKAADQVRVNVQLINALNDAHLWSEIYDRKLTDIFAVESDVAKTIADTLQAKLTGAEKQMISGQPTSDTAAYELYLKGRLLWGKRGGDNLRQAIAFYEQAIARDPNFALAYAALAEVYVILPVYSATAPGDVYPKAKAAALKALQLDDKLAEAHTALADALYNDFDMAGSIAEFQRAIALNPNYATAHQWYGNDPLASVGRFDESIAEGKRAIELDPLSPIVNSDLGVNLFYARRYDAAIAQLRKTLEIDPTFYYAHVVLGEALQLKGDVPTAIAEYEKAQQLSDSLRPRVLLTVAKAQSGDKEAATRMLAELAELRRHRYVSAYSQVLLNLSLNNREEAIRWLEQDVANHEGQAARIKVSPLLDPLRGDPRFEALVQKVVGPKQK